MEDAFTEQETISRELQAKLVDAQTAHEAGDLEAADKHYAGCVSIVNKWPEGKKKDKQLVEIFLNMSDIHQQKGLDGHRHPGFETLHERDRQYWTDDHLVKLSKLMHFRNSAGFLNSAYVRLKNNMVALKQIEEKLVILDRHIVHSITGKSCTDKSQCLDIDNQNIQEIRKIRQSTKSLLKEIDLSGFDPSSSTQPNQLTETLFIEHIEKIYNKLHQIMTDFLKNIWKQCISILHLTPPKHAVILFGSLGRKEATPFSDIEFGVLLEDDCKENRQILREVVLYMYTKVINLKETILPNLGISNMQIYASSFFDMGPRGIKFDAYFPWASKIPLGRIPTEKKPWRLEFIGSPDALASLQSQEKSFGESYHVSQVLRNCSFLCGDEDLYNTYREKVARYNMSSTAYVKQEATDVLKTEIPEKMPNLGFNMEGDKLNAKADIYRIPSLFITNCAVLNELKTDSQWQAIRQLKAIGVFSNTQSHHVLLMQSIAAYIRLYIYFLCNRQEDDFPVAALFEPGSKALASGLNIIPPLIYKQMLFSYLSIAHSICCKLRNLTKTQTVSFATDDMFVLMQPLEIAAVYCRLQWNEKVIEHLEVDLALLSLIGNGDTRNFEEAKIHTMLGKACHNLSKYAESMEHFQIALSNIAQAPSDASVDLLIKTKQCMAMTYCSMGQLKDAVRISDECLHQAYRFYGNDACNYVMVSILNGLGIIYQTSSRFGDSNKCFHEAEVIMRRLTNDSPSKLAAAIKHNMAYNSESMGEGSRAITMYKECLAIEYKFYGSGACNESIAKTYNSLGNAFKEQSHYKEASVCYEKAAAMMDNISTDGSPHALVARIKHGKAELHLELGQMEDAIMLFKESLTMRYLLYGLDACSEEIAVTLNGLGGAYSSLSEYSISNEYYKKAAAIMKHLSVDDGPTILGVMISLNMGFNLIEMNQAQEAITLLKDCLHNCYIIYGKDACNIHVIKILNCLGLHTPMEI